MTQDEKPNSDHTKPSDADADADAAGLDRHPDPDEFPSDPGVQAERQEEGVEAEWEHE